MKKISVMCYLGIPLLLALSMGACTNAPGVPEDTGGADVGGDATPCGESADCDDGNPCTLDECIAGACSWAPVEAACDDGNPCTEGDQCMEGDCAGTPKICDDSVFCNGEETCNAVTGACEDGTAPSIDDGVTCTLDECDEEGDKVIHVPNDTACDDGNPCTTNTCDETLDCQVADRDGEDCEDGSLCTEGDVCDGDTCIGQDVECEDEDFCNGVETCDPETGGCVDGTPPELDDGLDCTQDSCDEDLDEVVHTPEDAACDDGNSCTTDTCDGGEGCVYDTLDDGAACEDGNDCTEGDVCADGLCEPGTFVCVEDCNNEEDDDQDDLVDCDDEDCFLDMACQPGGDLCGEAFDLTLGVPLVAADAGGTIQFLGTTVGKTHEFTGACDPDTAQAVDTVHKIELGEPLGLSITGDFNGNAWASVYILNAACTGNLACATSSSIEPTELTVVLPAGTYFITMDGAYPGDLGTYVLEVGVFLPDATETACADGVDNDADGLMDCDDDECDDAEECNILTGETCADALLLTPAPLTAAAAGTQVVITGTTAGNADNVEGSCNAAVATSPDLIYRLNLADPLVVAATFDFSGNKWPALALFRDGCAAEDELACDTGKADAAAVGPIALKAGTYLLVLDAAYNNDAGPFTLSVSFTAVPAAETLCSNGVDDDLDDLVDCDDPSCDADPVCAGYEGDNCAHPFLVNGGQPVTAAHYGQTLTLQGSTAGLQDFYTACSPNTAGSPEAVYALELGVPALVHATHDFGGTLWPAVYAMDASCDPGTLLGCDTATSGAAELDLALAPGTYYF
ncbi:MAG: hypothetical protein FJ098_03770, partial [Deltaproteobacteria bacterium]|nr:hypothetical protein [Deltaproteobacteria bacterium]